MTHSPHPIRIQRYGQLALGIIWLIDGALQFQPYMFHRTFVTGVILPSADGQPGVIASPITWLSHLIEPRVAVFNALAASLQVLIGLALISRRMTKPALGASFAWAGAIWFAGEGLGGLFNGTADPLTGAPGAALLYIVAGAIVWPRRDGRFGLLGAAGAKAAWCALWLGLAALWLLPANSHGGIAPAMAVLSLAVALSALTGVATLSGLALGIGVQAVFWFAGQQLSDTFSGSGTDVGTAPLVVLIGAILLAAALTEEARRARVRRVLTWASGTARASSDPTPDRA